jgi:hypothetical protein
VGGDEEVLPPVVDQPKGESTGESVVISKDDLLTDVQELKAQAQEQATMSSEDHPQPSAVPDPSLSPPPVAEEPTPISTSPLISPRRSTFAPEPSGIRSPPPLLTGTEEKESKQLAVENDDGEGEGSSPKIAKGLTASPFRILSSPPREAPAAIAKPEPALASPVVAEEDIIDEAEEEARKKRVAERLAKMGAFNPFSVAPPPAQDKAPQETSPSPPPVPVAFIPFPLSVLLSTTVQDRAQVAPGPLKPVRRDSTTKSNAEDASDGKYQTSYLFSMS